MAKCLPSIGGTELRGRVAAVVYSRSSQGSTFRTKSRHRPTISGQQLLRRALFARAVTRWRQLSSADRQKWVAQYESLRTESFGLFGRPRSAFQLYVGMNVVYRLLQVADLSRPPLVTSGANLQVSIGPVSIASTHFDAGIANPFGSSIHWGLFVTAPYSAGQGSNPNRSFRMTGNYTSATVINRWADISAAWYPFSSADVGKKVDVRAIAATSAGLIAVSPVRTVVLA